MTNFHILHEEEWDLDHLAKSLDTLNVEEIQTFGNMKLNVS